MRIPRCYYCPQTELLLELISRERIVCQDCFAQRGEHDHPTRHTRKK